MKKLILKLSIITIIIFTLMPLNNSYAAEATLSVNNAYVGEKITVMLLLPDGIYGCQGNATIKYSDGTTQKEIIAEMNTNDIVPISSVSESFEAKDIIGNATVTVSNLVLMDENLKNINTSNSSIQKTIQILKHTTPEPTEEPEEPEEPEETPIPTKEPEPTFTSVNDTVYVTSDNVNLRASYTTTSDSYKRLDAGTKFTRIGIVTRADGQKWAKVEYENGVAYIYNNYLTTEKPQETPEATPTPSPTPSESPDITPSPTPEEDEESKNKKNYEKLVKEVGVLPEVGNNITKYLYVSMICISCIGIIIINKIFKE